MTSCKLSWRDTLAVLLAVLSLVGLAAMFCAESSVVLPSKAAPMSVIFSIYGAHVLPALQKYSLAFGAILVVVSISYILLGHEEEISTVPGEQERKK